MKSSNSPSHLNGLGISLFHCGLTDIGLNRPTNQDIWTALPEIGFFALADGMGGRKGGAIAAKETIRIVCKEIQKLAIQSKYFQKEIDLSLELRSAIEVANEWVVSLGKSCKQLAGMGTTFCCLLWTPSAVYYAHVGDSRVYLLRNGKLHLLTQDHSLFARWLQKRRPTPLAPPKHIITRAVGTSLFANPEIAFCQALPSDIFFLCSDGLSDFVSRRELEKILYTSSSIKKAADNMIKCAKNNGGNDNITVLITKSGNHSSASHASDFSR